MRKFILSLLITLAVVVCFTHGSAYAAPEHNVPGVQLAPEWHADSGTPAAWNGTYVWLYDDMFNKMGSNMMPAPDAEIHRNAIVVDGEWIVDPLPKLADGGYWWQDGIELADGRFFVLATEFKNRWDLEPPMQFEVVDTDGFIVTDPSNAMSWKFATKVEDGPWGNDSVSFIDGNNMAVARDPYANLLGTETELFSFTDVFGEWEHINSDLPDGDAVVVPVQTESGWWALTWSMWHEVTLWYTPADKLGTEQDWVMFADLSTELETHYHTLMVIDGDVYWRSNNLDGSRRPEYELVSL